MSLSTPVQRVVKILEAAGYRQLDLPLVVASVPFDFAAALVGTDRIPDLVVVVDTMNDADIRSRQKIDGLGRAMDVAGSRRPLTAVLAGPRPAEPTLSAIGRVCRVLPIGTLAGVDADRLLQEWLSVLLPLNLPDASGAGVTASGELAQHLPTHLDPRLKALFLEAAPRGEDAVQTAFRDLLASTLIDQLGEEASQS
jgi:hypothetical protein